MEGAHQYRVGEDPDDDRGHASEKVGTEAYGGSEVPATLVEEQGGKKAHGHRHQQSETDDLARTDDRRRDPPRPGPPLVPEHG